MAACGGREATPSGAATTLRVSLHAVAVAGGVGGSALFERIDGGGTRVTIDLDEPITAGADIRDSDCGDFDASPVASLAAVVNGHSETELEAPLSHYLSRESSLQVRADPAAKEAFPLACGDFGSAPPKPPAVPPRQAAAIAACHPPVGGYGFARGTCARLERMVRVRNRVWRLQLRGPPVYCVEMHLGAYSQDDNVNVDRVGELREIRCPDSAYRGEPEPDVRVRLRGTASGKLFGTVTLTAVGTRRTRVVVTEGAWSAHVRPGTCRGGGLQGNGTPLGVFYSGRSVTTLHASIRSLLSTPHVVEVFPPTSYAYGCAPLRRHR